MGGKSSSSTATNYTDNRVTGGEGSNIWTLEGTDNQINMLDGSAVANSLTFANELGTKSLDTMTEVFNSALDFVGAKTDKVLSANLSGLEAVIDSQKSANERIVSELSPYLMGGVSLVAIIMAWRAFR